MSIDKRYIYSEITEKIIELAIEVHKALGPGFAEKFYERALIHELSKNKIKYTSQKAIYVKYDNISLGMQKVDLMIEDKVIVELKVISEINEISIAQAVSYLKASGTKVGLILNFAKSRLEIRRVII